MFDSGANGGNTQEATLTLFRHLKWYKKVTQKYFKKVILFGTLFEILFGTLLGHFFGTTFWGDQDQDPDPRDLGPRILFGTLFWTQK